MDELFESIPLISSIVLSIVFILTGSYQIITGKKSFLMCTMVRKYNLAEGFTKIYGYMTMAAGCILFGTCFGYWYFSKMEILYTGFIFLCILVFCKPFIIRKYQMDIDGTNKKSIIKNSIFVLLIIGIGFYFRPMSISSLFDDTTVIKISYSNLGIADGETYIEDTGYHTLTEEEKTHLLAKLSKYTYFRKISTIFSNGSSNGIGNEIIMLYTENREKESQIICISSLGEIIVDNRVYTAKNSWKIIEEVKEINTIEKPIPPVQ